MTIPSSRSGAHSIAVDVVPGRIERRITSVRRHGFGDLAGDSVRRGVELGRVIDDYSEQGATRALFRRTTALLPARMISVPR